MPFPSDSLAPLFGCDQLQIVQQKEMLEIVFGFETRNQYAIQGAGRVLAYAAERAAGAGDMILRQFLGHNRSFELDVHDPGGRPLLRIEHPHRWFFRRLDVYEAESGRRLGAIEQRFAVLGRRFDVLDGSDTTMLEVRGSFFKPWTFPFSRDGRVVGRIEKQWSGMFTELVTDADRFRLTIDDAKLGPVSRLLILSAALFIDLEYFERKSS